MYFMALTNQDDAPTIGQLWICDTLDRAIEEGVSYLKSTYEESKWTPEFEALVRQQLTDHFFFECVEIGMTEN